MELAEAVRRHLPLQVRVPHRFHPLETVLRYAAEVFLVDTKHGPAVVWLDPFWCQRNPADAIHIAYATPSVDGTPHRWIDHDPRYGPKCLVCQKPFVIEQLDRGSSAWLDYKAWQQWRHDKSEQCGRRAAWKQVEATLAGLIVERTC